MRCQTPACPPASQTLRCAARHSYAANARQARRHRINIGQVHGQRIARLFAQLECRHGRGWRHNRIHFGKGTQKLLGQQSPHLLGLQIIGIVVAGRKRIRPQQNAPLDLGPEALVARVAVHGGKRPDAGER